MTTDRASESIRNKRRKIYRDATVMRATKYVDRRSVPWRTRLVASGTLGASLLVAASSLAAQDPFSDEVDASEVGLALPDTDPDSPDADVDSDHERVIGRLGVGLLGTQQAALAAPDGTISSLSVPTVGARYWLTPAFAVEAGMGLLVQTGSRDYGPETGTLGAPSALVLHAGLPISLAANTHFSFQLTPHANLGFAGQTLSADGVEETSLAGFQIGAGARIGAEIHFGFIDVPQLSLIAGVGVQGRLASVTVKGPGDNLGSTAFTLGTTLDNHPWQIFTGNVAALYYF